MTFLNDTRFHWQTVPQDDVTLTYKGHESFALGALDITRNLTDTAEITLALTAHLEAIQNFSSGLIETPTHIMAWVDHIRSWPIYYTTQDNDFTLSNNAKKVRDHAGLRDANVDPDSCLEFAMSGYVTGARTLYTGLHCLQPGEFLIWDKKTKKLTTTRYFQYLPTFSDTHSEEENMRQLGAILDRITLKIIKRANGRPIWVPLSGGLDSRILLCKLHEHGYQNIHTFTYGPHFNFEAGIAKKVARTLGVPWVFISPSMTKIREYFNSDDRKEFWNSTDGLKAIASMREFSALMNLREQKILHDDAILLNGQSGDYITGNHIAKDWLNESYRTPDHFYKVLFQKHYDLWKSLLTPPNLDVIKERISELLPENWKQSKNAEEWAALEETWEYEARQICLVANGQRSYDYFGLDWEMPLWEKSLVDFCAELPLNQKLDQSLYKNYLKDYNYKNLFPQQEPYIWRWPVLMLWVVPMAQLVQIIKGPLAKKNFYALMRFHGHYSNQFYSFSWAVHKKTYDIARNVMSLNVREWVIENPNIFSKSILKALRIHHVG